MSVHEVPKVRYALRSELQAKDTSAMSTNDFTRDLPLRIYSGFDNLQKALQYELDIRRGKDPGYDRICMMPFRPDSWDELQRWRERLPRGIRIFYLADVESLIIKCMPSAGHELGGFLLMHHFDTVAIGMGLGRQEYVRCGSALKKGANSGKEPDDCLYPRKVRNPHTSSDWPTLVFECGDSESLRHLHLDARWWLHESAGLVQIVLLLGFRRAQRTLHLEKWVYGDNGPESEQQVLMKSDPDLNTVVTGAPLVLEFRRLFLREPTSGEHDIVYDEETLKGIARDIWLLS